MNNEEILKNSNERTECEVYTRVVGYIRPINNWNAGKKAEYHDRKVFDKSL